MQHSEQNRHTRYQTVAAIRIASLLTIVTTACATSSYKIANRDKDAIELEVTPDRVTLECEYASEKKEVPYGFMILVLDDQKTVLTIAQMNTLSKEECFERLDTIARLLKAGNRIYIAGVGDIDQVRVEEKWQVNFPKHGTFNTNGRSLQFFSIANEHGSCFDAYQGAAPPCPQSGIFPLKKASELDAPVLKGTLFTGIPGTGTAWGHRSSAVFVVPAW